MRFPRLLGSMKVKGKTRFIPKTAKQNTAEPDHQTSKTDMTKTEE